MRGTLILVLTLLSSSAAAQKEPGGELRLLVIAHTYRERDTPKALEMLGVDDTDLQRRAARTALASHKAGDKWTVPLLRAAGAVHMEQALALYKRGGRDVSTGVLNQIEIGELLLDEVANFEKQLSDAVRWEWAIAQQAMADGEFRTARSIMFRACDRYPAQAMLLLGCGTLHETEALLSVDIVERLRNSGGILWSPTGQAAASSLGQIRAYRRKELSTAAEAFAEVRRLDPSNLEASLRLGYIRLVQGDPAAAASVLEPLVDAPSDRRIMYLSRLFLGRAMERQGRADVALSVYRGAAAVRPAQSARLALAERLHAAGLKEEAHTLAESVSAGGDLNDPWWSYRFGQYWLVEPMLDALREEARR